MLTSTLSREPEKSILKEIMQPKENHICLICCNLKYFIQAWLNVKFRKKVNISSLYYQFALTFFALYKTFENIPLYIHNRIEKVQLPDMGYYKCAVRSGSNETFSDEGGIQLEGELLNNHSYRSL